MPARASPREGGTYPRRSMFPINTTKLVTEWRGRGEPIVLAWFAGALFLAEGLYASSYPVTLPFASVSLASAGAVSAVAGLTVILVAAFYITYGSFRAYLGTLLVLICTGDLWFGGGFWVGSILGTIAGVLVIVLPPYPVVNSPESRPDTTTLPPPI